MKRTRYSAITPLLAICALLTAGVNQNAAAREKEPSSSSSATIFATGAADGGRLIIKRSPALGVNVPIAIRIDGKPAGSLGYGHTFNRYITPGRHLVTATPLRSPGDAWAETIELQAGQTYSYVAVIRSGRLVLSPLK